MKLHTKGILLYQIVTEKTRGPAGGRAEKFLDEKRKKSFAIGQTVKVRVTQADARERTVDFVLAD